MTPVKQAEAALRAAQEDEARCKLMLTAAEARVGDARKALSAAREAADAKLPRATMVEVNWRGVDMGRYSVVIARRTAKQIVVRRPGDTHEFTFRADKPGQWRRYPRPKASTKGGYLENVPEEAKP